MSHGFYVTFGRVLLSRRRRRRKAGKKKAQNSTGKPRKRLTAWKFMNCIEADK